MAARKYWWAAAIAVMVYATMWFGYSHHWSGLATVDYGILGYFHDFGVHRPGWLSFWHDISTLFGTKVLSSVAAVVAIVALVYRQWRVAVFLTMTVVLMGLVTAAAKALVHRPRPTTMMDFEGSTSFPSGHALGITVAVLSFATVLWPGLSRGWRTAVTIGGSLLIPALMLARVILNVHHPSDVAAGCALGFIWYLLWVSIIPPWPDENDGTAKRHATAPVSDLSADR